LVCQTETYCVKINDFISAGEEILKSECATIKTKSANAKKMEIDGKAHANALTSINEHQHRHDLLNAIITQSKQSLATMMEIVGKARTDNNDTDDISKEKLYFLDNKVNTR
jgi:hypothetical protein